jgi:hypothetical protein
LILSANTAFADFPRLSAVIATDGYMPRQLANRGDRLAFSNGIIALALAAGGLLVGFGARVTSLVPLFAVGLFASFTLSQAGMVRRHLLVREPHWRTGLAINLLGSIATLVVLAVVLLSKFTSGAWVPTVVIPIIVAAFVSVRRHYDRVAATLAVRPHDIDEVVHHTVAVLVARPTRPVVHAIRYAQAMQPDHLIALTVIHDPGERDSVLATWSETGLDVPLDVIVHPYRNIAAAVIEFLDRADARWADDTLTVIIPEFVVHRWWEHTLHNQSALALKARLLYRRNTVVTSVPWHVD